MADILIIYASDYGGTKKMTEAVASGVNSVEDARAVVKQAEETTAEDMITADGIIFGSPVHMGSLDWRIKKFIDEICGGLWMKDTLKGKVGAAFVVGGGFGKSGSGAELTLLTLMANMAELGMILIPLPKGTPGYVRGGLHWGPVGRSMDDAGKPVNWDNDYLEVARHHGSHVARAAMALKNNKIYG